MSSDWPPEVIRNMRDRVMRKACEPDGIARWMARCSTDREFCRWIATLGLEFTESEAEIVLAVIAAGASDWYVLVDAEEYDALRLAVAMTRFDGQGPHVQPHRAKARA